MDELGPIPSSEEASRALDDTRRELEARIERLATITVEQAEAMYALPSPQPQPRMVFIGTPISMRWLKRFTMEPNIHRYRDDETD
jgi:hypothetical protein